MNEVKIFIVFNKTNISGRLTKFFTGCYAYHIGFVVPDSDAMYDMNLLFRKVGYKGRYDPENIHIFDLPPGVNLTEADLQNEVFKDVAQLCEGHLFANLYGFIDYVLFSVRGLYHLFGKSTRNMSGKICSEKVNDLLMEHGWDSPFKAEVPSPCDFVPILQSSK